MAYRNKTYVAFAGEDIHHYYLMQAWKANEHIDFNFFDAHDINTARDTSDPETIRRRLRERMASAKQAVLLGSPRARSKGGDGHSFLAYEVKYLLDLGLPVVIANLNASRTVQSNNIPQPIYGNSLYTVSVSFQPKIIQFALDNYVDAFATSSNSGHHVYNESTYQRLGL
jgi:hypothetical protein